MRGRAELLVCTYLLEKLDHSLRAFRSNAIGFRRFLRFEEERSHPVIVHGSLRKRFRHDGRLSELDAETKMDDGMKEAYSASVSAIGS
jgi:hypothetical protein